VCAPRRPPDIKLVRISIEDVRERGTLRQRINVIVKNNGDLSAFLMTGRLVAKASETIKVCNQIGMQFDLSKADWTYDVDISEKNPIFVGRHSIAPNEVVNFWLAGKMAVTSRRYIKQYYS
jgi:hypothetical protein